jgi:hypothetical protein
MVGKLEVEQGFHLGGCENVSPWLSLGCWHSAHRVIGNEAIALEVGKEHSAIAIIHGLGVAICRPSLDPLADRRRLDVASKPTKGRRESSLENLQLLPVAIALRVGLVHEHSHGSRHGQSAFVCRQRLHALGLHLGGQLGSFHPG